MDDERIIRGAALRSVDLFRRTRIERISSKTIDCLCRKSYKAALTNDTAEPLYFILIIYVVDFYFFSHAASSFCNRSRARYRRSL